NACVKRFGKKILDGEINRKLIEGALAKAQLQVTQPEIDQEIRRAAEYFGFVKADGSADIPQLLQSIEQDDNMTPELYVRDVIWPTVALKKLTAGQVQVTEEDIQKGFDANYGPRAEVLAIVLSNQRTAQQVWEMARNNSSEQFFGELASQYSVEDSSRSNFGKVPPLRRNSGQPTLEKAAFDLQPGALSGIVEVNGRYVILKSQGFTKPVVSGLNQAIRTELHREIEEKKHRIAMDQCLNKLRDDAQIVDFSDLKKSRVSSQDLREAQQVLEQQPR
nr:peptidylprolyl isomerase [Pirellula sp.]